MARTLQGSWFFKSEDVLSEAGTPLETQRERDVPGDTEGARGHSPSKAACDRVGGEEGAQDVG